MRKLHLKAGKGYGIFIDKGIMENCGSYISKVTDSRHMLVVTDDIVDSLYSDCLIKSLSEYDIKAEKFVLKNGEASKSFAVLNDILEFASRKGLKRNDVFIALGGGVVGDITGLASALYMRGVDFIQLPTTLLSCVDSSIGGKTAVNLSSGKNLAGVFHQPSLVLIDSGIMEKLPKEVFEEGLSELLKSGIIGGFIDGKTDFNADFVRNNIEELIEKSLTMKAGFVEADEFDKIGIRNVLNLGHTAAHAIEKLSGYSISHGNAVAKGIAIETAVGNRIGLCDNEFMRNLKTKLENSGFDLSVNYSAKALTDAMKTDKKNRDDDICFVFARDYGKTVEMRIPADELAEILTLLGL